MLQVSVIEPKMNQLYGVGIRATLSSGLTVDRLPRTHCGAGQYTYCAVVRAGDVWTLDAHGIKYYIIGKCRN